MERASAHTDLGAEKPSERYSREDEAMAKGCGSAMSETDQSLSILAARRAIAAIEDMIERIHEEGREGDRAGWYALDRFRAIEKIARAAADGQENAGYHYYSEHDPMRDRSIAVLDQRKLKFGDEPAGEVPDHTWV